MIKYICTMSIGEDIYYASVVAQDPDQARELAIAETNKNRKRSGYEGRARNWSVRVLEPEAEGPARVLDAGVREA